MLRFSVLIRQAVFKESFKYRFCFLQQMESLMFSGLNGLIATLTISTTTTTA